MTSNDSRVRDASIEPKLLDSGAYQDVCPDCGTTTTTGATLEDMLDADCACQAQHLPLHD